MYCKAGTYLPTYESVRRLTVRLARFYGFTSWALKWVLRLTAASFSAADLDYFLWLPLPQFLWQHPHYTVCQRGAAQSRKGFCWNKRIVLEKCLVWAMTMRSVIVQWFLLPFASYGTFLFDHAFITSTVICLQYFWLAFQMSCNLCYVFFRSWGVHYTDLSASTMRDQLTTGLGAWIIALITGLLCGVCILCMGWSVSMVFYCFACQYLVVFALQRSGLVFWSFVMPAWKCPSTGQTSQFFFYR